MVQSVELLFDDVLEHDVVQEWAKLVDAGLPSQARHTGSSNRPHITLGVARALTAEQEAAVAAAVGALPLPVRLGGLLVFGSGPFVLSRLVVPSEELLAVQRRVVSALGDAALPFAHQQRPGAWTGHVTLARRLDAARLAAAVSAVAGTGDLSGAVVAARRWDGDAREDWLVAGGSGRAGADQLADHEGDRDGDRAQQ